MRRKNTDFQCSWTKGKQGSSDAFYIRTKVFIIEQGFQNEFDDLDSQSWHLTVYHGEEPVAAARIFQNQDGSYQAGRICVLEEYRGRKLGRLLMEEIAHKVRELGGARICLGAQLQAQGFYQKQGYHPCGPEYQDEHCPHIPMECTLAQ